jgi:hypothetical protein
VATAQQTAAATTASSAPVVSGAKAQGKNALDFFSDSAKVQ